jgi:hypothetical protein
MAQRKARIASIFARVQHSLREETNEALERFLNSQPPVPFISTATPMVLNQRLSLQQGVFVFPGDVARSWQENLDALNWSEKPHISRCFVLNLDLDDAFERLHRMNVTARSLFPGLDGYGKFMFDRATHLLEIPVLGE